MGSTYYDGPVFVAEEAIRALERVQKYIYEIAVKAQPGHREKK